MSQFSLPLIQELDGCIQHVIYLKKSIANLDQELAEDLDQQFELISKYVHSIADQITDYVNDPELNHRIELLRYEISELQQIVLNRQDDIMHKLHSLQKLQTAWEAYNKNS